jgi:hypothetical protein
MLELQQSIEGTNGIQALDLIGSKLQTDNGALFKEFFSMIDNYQNKINNNQDMRKYNDLFYTFLQFLQKYL